MKKIKLIFSSVILLVFASCQKVIDVKETDNIGGDVALKTVANNEAAVLGAYAMTNPEMAILFNAVMSDEVKVGEFTNQAIVHEWQFASADIAIRDNYTAMAHWYRVIDRSNRAIAALPNADSMKVGDNQLRARVRGEALFLRAYSHFELFRYYSGNYDPEGLAMPYLETPSLQDQARIKMGPYFQKINADVAEAKALLPNNTTDVRRATRAAASALQARIALYMRDWANAITYSTEAINAVPLATRAQFPGIWKDSTNQEVIFEIARATGSLALLVANIHGPSGRVGSMFRNTSASATNIGTIFWLPSDKLWNSYDQTNDIRFSSYMKVETALPAPRPQRIITKYAGTGYATANENINDVKIFRTAEMYLIRAEARAETNDLVGAAADIQTLRNARLATPVTVTYTTKEAAITDILEARFRELAFEGHRFWDLKRRNLPVIRLASDAPTASATTLPAGNFRFVLPIPNSEIQANPLMVQNPGYTN